MSRKRFNYIYRPGLMDELHPNVIKGHAIIRNTEVRVAAELHPPMLPTNMGALSIVFIEDKQGNVQSVFRKALQRKEGK